MDLSRRERLIPLMMISGVICFVVGLILFATLPMLARAMPAVPLLGAILAALGFILGVGGVVLGWGTVLKRRRSKDVITHADCLIVARFGHDHTNQMCFDEEFMDLEDPDTRLYLRIKLADGRSDEFRVQPELWRQCGEGFRGAATIQGDYVIGFQRYATPVQEGR